MSKFLGICVLVVAFLAILKTSEVSVKYREDLESEVKQLRAMNSVYRSQLDGSVTLKEHEAQVKLLQIEAQIVRLKPSIQDAQLTAIASATLKYSEEYNVDSKLMLSIACAESDFNPTAVSGVGARGLMQVMPLWVDGLEFVNTKEDLFSIDLNIRAGAYILADYLEMFKGNRKMALLAYNRGPGNVMDDLQNKVNPDNGYPSVVMGHYHRIRND